jgi:cytochrome c5
MKICAATLLGIAACGQPVEPALAPTPAVVAEAPSVEPSAAAPSPHAEREQVRAVLEEACGKCHIGGASEQPAALGVFDLTEPDFAARMTDEQLEAMPERIESMGLPPDVAAAVLAYISVVFVDRRADEAARRDC